MGAFSGLTNTNFFHTPLFKQAEKYNYTEPNVLILKGEFEWLKMRYSEVYKNIKSCVRSADHRSPEEYAKDLVSSWLVEDYFLKLLNTKNAEFSVRLSGGDKKREILPMNKVSAVSDFLITFTDGTKRNLELMNNYTDFWEKEQKLHLREDKYLHLKEHKSLLLAVSMTKNTFRLYDFNSDGAENRGVRIPFHLPWEKPAYELSIPTQSMKTLSWENLKASILATKNESAV